MATSTDFSSFRFTAITNHGRRYVRAYRNIWVPKQTDAEGNVIRKGYSKPEVQIQVGPLLKSGRVKISDGFLLKFPEFDGVDWYLCKGSLVDEDTYYEMTKEDPETQQASPNEPVAGTADDGDGDDPPEERELNTRSFLPYFALANLCKECGITAALEQLFSRKQAMQWGSLAIYQLLCGRSADCFEEWALNQYLPEAAEQLDGRTITPLLQGFTEKDWDRFWKLRYEHSKKAVTTGPRHDGPHYLAFDSTSISTYAGIDDAAYGHAKQNPELKQVNLAVVFDQLSGDVVYAFIYEGSINDRATYSYIVERMTGAGFPMGEIVLVTDRGYYATFTAQKLLDEGVHYLSGVPIAKGSKEEKWILEKGWQITDHPVFLDAENEVACHTLTEQWSLRDNPKKETYTHVYYDPISAGAVKLGLNKVLVTTLDSLNKGITVDRNDMDKARPYLKEINDPAGDPHKQPRRIWVFNDEEIQRHHRRAGFFVVKSDIVSNPMLAYRLYGMRWGIEQGFDQMKNEINGRRLHVQQRSYRGKVFVYLIATALRMKIRYNLEQYRLRFPNSKMSLPGNSVTKLLMRMDRYKVSRNRSTEKWLCDMIPKKVREWLRVLFQCGVPPRKF